MRSLIKIVLGILLAWFIITVVIPFGFIVLLLVVGSMSQQEHKKEVVSTKEEVVSAKEESVIVDAKVSPEQNSCLDLMYSKIENPYVPDTYLSRVKKISISRSFKYHKPADGTAEQNLEVRLQDMTTSDTKVSVEIRPNKSKILLNSINFKLHGSEEEISLDVSNTPKGAHYIDFSKGSKNYEELLKVTQEGSTPKLRASSIETGKKSKILLTAEITDPPAHEYNGAPLLLKIRNAVDCITNPPEIPKDFTVVE